MERQLDKPDYESFKVRNTLTQTPFGFLGLGRMGSAMARNLASDGCQITVWNRSVAAMQPFTKEGIAIAKTPADLAQRCQILFTCVTDAKALSDVIFGQSGILSSNVSALQIKTIVDHSTISPKQAETIAKELRQSGIEFIDAPVTGGDIGAKNRTLTIMCGGSKTAVESCLPFLYRMAEKVYLTGPSGFGQRTKAVNQLLTAMNHLALAEAFALTRTLELDPELTLEIVGSGAAGSWAVTRNGPKVIAGDYAPGFKAGDQLKDLRFVIDAAKNTGLDLPGLKLLIERFEKLEKLGHADLGNHALALLYNEVAKD